MDDHQPDLTTNDPEKEYAHGGDDRRHDRARNALHDHLDQRIADDSGPPVGRNRRRQRPNHPQRRADLDERPAKHSGRSPAIWCSRVEASRFDEGTAYATFDGHRSDDFHVYVYKTVDYGKTWKAITAGIPDGQPVYVIREDLKNKNLLFLGTEFGAYVSRNAGQSWTNFSLNMPTVAVHDLLIHPRDNDLIAATHGRGFWIMDDISGLRQATDSLQSQDAAILEPGKPGTKWLRVQRADMAGETSSSRAKSALRRDSPCLPQGQTGHAGDS